MCCGVDVELALGHQAATDRGDAFEICGLDTGGAGQRAVFRALSLELIAVEIADVFEQLNRLVDGFARHPAVRGQLATGDDHESVALREYLVLPGDLRLVDVRW